MKTHKIRYSKATQLKTVWAVSTLLSSISLPQALALAANSEVFTSENQLSPQLISPVISQAVISPVDSEAQQEREVFDNSTYTFDDADDLAALWGMSIEDSKAYIGSKILQGESAVAGLNESLEEAHEKADAADLEEANANREVFYDSDYTYADAEALAAVWEISVNDAKARIGDKILYGGPAKDELDDILEAREDASSDPTGNSQRRAFYDSDYSYEDAEALADFWGISVSDAKTRVGGTILSGGDAAEELGEILVEAQAQTGTSGSIESTEEKENGQQVEEAAAAERKQSRWGSVVSAVSRLFGSIFG